MKSLMSKVALAFGAALFALAAMLVVNGLNYGPDTSARGPEITLPEPPTVYADEIATRVAQALRFQTITVSPGDPLPGREQPWLDLHDWLIATYPATHATLSREVVPGTLTLLYTWEGSDPSLPPLLFMAHQDVVPVNMGTQGDWTRPPFAGDIVDGILYGRGTIDDKSSLVGLMEAAETLIEEGFEPRRTIIFLFGHDEEVSGAGAAAAVDLLKSRGVRPMMALDEGFIVINPSPLTGKPMAYIGVAEKGYLSLVVTAVGEGGHSSTPPRDSAAVTLSRAVVALDENQMPADLSHPIVAGMFREAAPDLPFVRRMVFSNLWLFGGVVESQLSGIPAGNASIRTTTAPTMLSGSDKENVLAQRAQAVVNFRIHPKDSVEDVIAHAERVVSRFPGVSVARGEGGIRGANASPVSPTDTRAYAAIAAVAKRTGDGVPVAPGLVLGATDARYAYAITDNVYRFLPIVLTPEELTGFHGTNERISVENLGKMVEGYALLMMVLASE